MITAILFLSLTIGLLYIITFSIFLWGWLRGSQMQDFHDISPLNITVIIPCRNEALQLPLCLDALLHQNYTAGSLEIIVVDDHSTDDTSTVAGNYPVRVISLKNGHGKKAALVCGISEAKTEMIITTDADCQAVPGYLQSMADAFRRDGVVMVLGPVIMMPSGKFVSRFAALDFMSLQASGAGAAMSGRPLMANGANLAFSKTAFESIENDLKGGKSMTGDDMFLMMALKQRFGRESIVCSSDQNALIRTPAPESLNSFLSQRLRWVSKSRYYTDSWIISVAVLVFLFNTMIVLSLVLSFTDFRYLLLAGTVIFIKVMTDFPLLQSFASRTGQTNLLRLYPLASIVYPIYALLIGLGALVLRPRWKGRGLSVS